MTPEPLVFECDGAPLVGLLHRATSPSKRGVLMVVGGGPQYRLGGHRQLLLWARRLAAAGFHVLRFDYRGMGDSYGEFRGFEHVERDIAAALDAFNQQVPDLKEITLWGECDAASAILFSAWRHRTVRSLVLLNPWARTEAGQAKTILKHYYWERLRQPSFWKKLLSLRFNPLSAAASAFQQLRKALGSPGANKDAQRATTDDCSSLPLPERLLKGFQRFDGRVLLVMSGLDNIAREFDEVAKSTPAWVSAMSAPGLTRHDLAEADHTFSSAKQRDHVAELARQWLTAPSQSEQYS